MDQLAHRGLRFDRFTLDFVRGCLRADDEDIDLRPKAFEVLRHLVENAGRLVSKDELHRIAWPDVVVSEDSLVQCIRELRKKLGDNEHRLIKTISRRGYMLDVAVTEQQPQALGAGPAPDKPAGAPIRTAQGARWRVAAVAGTLLAVAAAVATSLSMLRPPLPAQARNPLTTDSDRRFSVVVLPFQNLGGDPAQERFVDAVTDSLTNGLSRPPGKVIALSTAFAYKGKPADVREIGRDLSVQYVVEGSVQRLSDDVRVTARLIDAQSAAQVWTDTFDIGRPDLDGLRDDITARLASSLNLELLVAQGTRSLRDHQHDPNATDFAIRGHVLLARGRDLLEARRLFREAVKRDDSLWGAWYGLASTYNRNIRFSLTHDDDLREAFAASERALALAPQEAAPHMAMGWTLYESKRMEQALAAFEHAVKLNPNYSFAHASVGAANIMLGHPENAIEPLRKAMRLSPRDSSLSRWQMMMGVALLHLQRYGEAVDVLTRSAAVDTHDPFTNFFLASALALAGRDADAKVQLGIFLRLQPAYTLSRFKTLEPSDTPEFRMQRARLYDGLRLAGLPE